MHWSEIVSKWVFAEQGVWHALFPTSQTWGKLQIIHDPLAARYGFDDRQVHCTCLGSNTWSLVQTTHLRLRLSQWVGSQGTQVLLNVWKGLLIGQTHLLRVELYSNVFGQLMHCFVLQFQNWGAEHDTQFPFALR